MTFEEFLTGFKIWEVGQVWYAGPKAGGTHEIMSAKGQLRVATSQDSIVWELRRAFDGPDGPLKD